MYPPGPVTVTYNPRNSDYKYDSRRFKTINTVPSRGAASGPLAGRLEPTSK